MWWPAIGGYYVETMGSCLYNNVSFLSYFLNLALSVNDFAELLCGKPNSLSWV